MNPAQIHLITNHIAVIGFPLILLIGILAIILKNVQYRGLVYGLTIVCSLGGFVAYFSGEQAQRWLYDNKPLALMKKNEYSPNQLLSVTEDKQAKGGSLLCFSEADLELHEELAERTFVFLIICCAISVAAGISYFKFSDAEGKLFWVLMLVMSISCFWLGKTAHQGGKINHSSIR
jgi:hypothetical protein